MKILHNPGWPASRDNHQWRHPDKHCYRSIAIFLYHIKCLFLPSYKSDGKTSFAFIPLTEINPRGSYEFYMLLLSEGNFVTWNFIENYMKTSEQNNCTQLYLLLYFNFTFQNIITEEEFTNQMCNHNSFCWCFFGLLWFFSIINSLKLQQKLQKAQAEAYIPPYNMCNLGLFTLDLQCFILSKTEGVFNKEWNILKVSSYYLGFEYNYYQEWGYF